MLTFSERLEQAEGIDDLLDLSDDLKDAMRGANDEIDILACEIKHLEDLLDQVDNAIAQMEDSD
jgi:hypothetical protein